jgi:hypothetical protein
MTRTHTFTRLLTGAALATAVLGSATLSMPTTDAAAPISALKVQAGGTEAMVSFATAEPASVTVEHKPAGMPAAATTAGGQMAAQGQGPNDALWGIKRPSTAPSTTAPVGQSEGAPLGGYATTHQRKLTGLQSNTAYEVTVTALTQSNQLHTATTRFTTARQRVRVTLREITITEDGDIFWMNGEPMWLVRLTWADGKTGACYPNNGNICETGDHGEGRIFPKNYLGQPLTWLFAEENFDTMPAAFSISAKGEEYDFVPALSKLAECFVGACSTGEGSNEGTYSTKSWQVPAGREWASTPIAVDADDSQQEFRSTLAFTFELFHDNLSYPAARNTPQTTWAR